MEVPKNSEVREILHSLRSASCRSPLWVLQRNEAVLWAAEEGILSDANKQELRILEKLRARRDAYYATVQLLSITMKQLGVKYCLIKCFRAHPYANTDVNVVVHPDDYHLVIQALRQRGWSIRSFWARTKEWVAERGKRKLIPPSGEPFAEIHLYPCATWHGLKYLDTYWIFQNSSSQMQSGIDTVASNPVSDLLLHYGHCAFERYSLTFAELYHLQLLRSRLGVDGLKQANAITAEFGWQKAFQVVDQEIEKWWASKDKVIPPISLPRSGLSIGWLERSRYHLNRGRVFAAGEEIIQHTFWSSPMYDIFRFYKRLRGRTHLNSKVIE